MATKRNHYDLKEIEEFLRTKTYPKRVPGKGEKYNFRRTSKRFSMDFTRRKVDLLFRTRIDNEILYITFTKGRVIPLILKQCQRILGETRHTKTFLLDFLVRNIR